MKMKGTLGSFFVFNFHIITFPKNYPPSFSGIFHQPYYQQNILNYDMYHVGFTNKAYLVCYTKIST